METYSALRQFADSWWLLVMFAFFVGVVIFTFRPGSRKTHRDIAEIPLRDDDPDRLKDDAEGEQARRRDVEADDGDEDDAPGKGRDGTDGRHERLIPKEI